jgi:hypothetical protein
LVTENRTYDQILGDLDRGKPVHRRNYFQFCAQVPIVLYEPNNAPSQFEDEPPHED